MIRRPRRLRWRLTLSISLVLLVAVGATFVAVYSGTGSALRSQIDRELTTDANAFAHSAISGHATTPQAAAAAARRYVTSQPFRASAQFLYASVPGQGAYTNEPELLALQARESDEHPAAQRAENALTHQLLAAPRGFSVVDIPDVGPLRLLTRGLTSKAGPPITIGVGEPLQSVHRAQHEVAVAFALAGSLAVLATIIAVYLLAGSALRPLRRMATVAARVDGGDLSPRMAAEADVAQEIEVLAEAFDHMLERLADAFVRQRAFVSDASHELRTPLTVIRGQIEVLARQRDPKPEDLRRVERLVLAEVDRMGRLVEDLLLLAHTDEVSFLELQSIDLPRFVQELYEGVSHTADRDFQLSRLPAGVLSADPDRLAQALRNLVRNAVEHTGPGGLVRLAVSASGERIVFAVEDDGPGIPADERERIFDRFHRTDASRSRAAGGTGLGLAIVSAIVEAHRGRVAVGSSAEGGARVALEIPGFLGAAQSARTGRARPTPVASGQAR